jgi:hypothetical protein
LVSSYKTATRKNHSLEEWFFLVVLLLDLGIAENKPHKGYLAILDM